MSDAALDVQTSNALVPRPYQTLALKRHTHCTNCGSPLYGTFCQDCGQRDIDFQQDWGELVEEVYTSAFKFDGKVLKGIVQLLFNPGAVTGNYLEGKRVSQIPPIRFYLTVILLFFFTLFIQNRESFEARTFSDLGKVVSIDNHAVADDFPSWVSVKMQEAERIQATFFNWLPKAFLLGMPILAFFSWFCFYKESITYIEHLVIVIHLQTFVMLWLLVTMGWGALIGLTSHTAELFFCGVTSLWIWAYPMIALRRIMKKSWWKTILTGLAIEGFWVIYLCLSLFTAMSVAILSE